MTRARFKVKAGDLVKWVPAAEPSNSKVGLLVEWDVATDELPASGWVRWQGEPDWSIVYEDDIEVISEGG